MVDCAKPVEDKIMDIASLEKFLQERIKVGGKAGALGESVTVTREKNKISVTSDSNFSKRYRKIAKLDCLIPIPIAIKSNLLDFAVFPTKSSCFSGISNTWLRSTWRSTTWGIGFGWLLPTRTEMFTSWDTSTSPTMRARRKNEHLVFSIDASSLLYFSLLFDLSSRWDFLWFFFWMSILS